jgi:hypothetical protein
MHCCCTAAELLLHCCCTADALLLHCFCTDAELLLHSLLPGPEQAGPPFQQKYTTIWQKHTANSYF